MQPVTTTAQPPRRNVSLRSLMILLFLAVIAVFLYTFVHEAGHAIFGLIFGGKLTSFSVKFWDLSAHAGLRGNFSILQRSVISAAGVGLPLVLWAAFLSLSPKKTNGLLTWFKLFISLGTLNTLLAWIIIPFLHMAGRAPSDDATNFLNLTGIPPLLVAAAALAAYIYGWALLLNRIGGLQELRSLLSGPAKLALTKNLTSDPSSRRSLVHLLGIFGLMVALSLGMRAFYPFADALAVPEDYAPVFMLDLSRRGYDSETVYSFSLDEPDEVGLYFAIQNVQRGPVRITLTGANGYQNTFLRGSEDFRTGQATVNPSHIPLEAGEYRVEVTFPESEGSVSGAFRFSETAE